MLDKIYGGEYEDGRVDYLHLDSLQEDEDYWRMAHQDNESTLNPSSNGSNRELCKDRNQATKPLSCKAAKRGLLLCHTEFERILNLSYACSQLLASVDSPSVRQALRAPLNGIIEGAETLLNILESNQ